MRRFLIVIIAVAWGVWTGSSVIPELNQAFDTSAKFQWSDLPFCAMMAVFFSSPLIIAAIVVVDKDMRWRKIFRRCYAFLMIFFVAGGSIPLQDLPTPFALPYSLTSVILLWPEIRAFLRRGQDWRRLLVVSGLVIGVLGMLIWWYWFRFPLPSDQKMIEHLNTHRSELEQLVKSYYNHRRGDPPFPSSYPEVLARMEKVSIEKINRAGSRFGEWYPNPYSDHTFQVKKSIEKYKYKNDEASQREALEILHREFPSLFDGTAQIHSIHDIMALTSPMEMFYWSPYFNQTRGVWLDSRKPGRKAARSPRYPESYLIKGFCYYPQPPRVENGHIIIPGNPLGLSSQGVLVVESLDDFPPNLGNGEYVLKRIDDHWFIYILLFRSR